MVKDRLFYVNGLISDIRNNLILEVNSILEPIGQFSPNDSLAIDLNSSINSRETISIRQIFYNYYHKRVELRTWSAETLLFSELCTDDMIKIYNFIHENY